MKFIFVLLFAVLLAGCNEKTIICGNGGQIFLKRHDDTEKVTEVKTTQTCSANPDGSFVVKGK